MRSTFAREEQARRVIVGISNLVVDVDVGVGVDVGVVGVGDEGKDCFSSGRTTLGSRGRKQKSCWKRLKRWRGRLTRWPLMLSLMPLFGLCCH